MAQKRILLCAGTGCISSGALKVEKELRKELADRGMEERVEVVLSGCHGFCEKGALLIVHPEEVFYCNVQPGDMAELVEEHLMHNRLVERLLYKDPLTGERVKSHHQINFYSGQMRNVLRNCGVINPENIDEYLERDGYLGLEKALSLEGTEIIEEVIQSGLRGRGGAGFPTGLKWQFTHKASCDKKYIVCNADEGDPGAFMDRSVLEGDPHAVIEGMIIAAFAIGADEGYIYVRAEYPLAIRRLRVAIDQAKERGYLGDNVMDTAFAFDLKIKEGAGAFVCGEETALIASLEGERGMPRPRPPFPANAGLWGRPTCLNNVETFANIPYILRHGAEEFALVGTEKSKGTKVFALTGKISNTGLAEVPMGISLRKIIDDIGGGVKDGKRFKAVQIGGPSGGCLPDSKLDLPVDYDSLITAGAIMGSGGLVVMDDSTCMVDLAKFFLTFTQSESCGKCTPCREGTKRMLEILENITEGKGKSSDIELLEEMSSSIRDSSLCGLGQTAPNPVLSTLRYFREEYMEHIENHFCRAGACTSLIAYSINAEKCTGCTACVRVCPVSAIAGERKEVHEIDVAVCTKCGQCADICKFDAVIIK